MKLNGYRLLQRYAGHASEVEPSEDVGRLQICQQAK